MDDVHALPSDRRAELKRGTRIELAQRVAREDVEPGLLRAARQWFAGTRCNDRAMTTACKLGGEPERLPLAAAPAVLRIDMQHPESHRAQLPGPSAIAQGLEKHGKRDTGDAT
jgi:ferric-dicitrate binding protein FerR (iron transport regulator)